MSFQGDYAKNKRLLQENSTWRLLRADNAPLVLAFLSDLFSESNEVTFSEARVSLESALSRLREQGLWDAETSAASYLNQWSDNEWLRRGTDDELAVTDALDSAFRIIQGLDTRAVGTSASHLRIVQESLRDFAAAISPNIDDRLAILERKRREIDNEIAALKAGEVVQLTELQQRERVREIFQLAYLLPGDFRLVEDEIRALDKTLRVQMVDSDANHGTVLIQAMDHEDLLAQTEAGSAFEGFYTLLCDDNRNMELREHIRNILNHSVAQYLNPFQRQFLSKIMRELARESDRVFMVRRRTEKGLRDYIESGSALENKAVVKLISQLERTAVYLRDNDVDLKAPTSITLPIDAVKVGSPETLRLKMPEERINTSTIKENKNKREPSSSMIDALDSIDVRRVAESMKSGLKEQGPMTIKALIHYVPINEGIEELVAYLRVAKSVKATSLPNEEVVSIADKDGSHLKATIPRYLLSYDLFPNDINTLAL